MGNNSYTININELCGENWQTMIESQVGKFCSRCTKHVVDFSQLTDNEIISLIEKSNGKLCGRFKQSQLDRILSISKENETSLKYKQILAGLLVLSNATSSFGASENTTSKKETNQVQIETLIPQPNDTSLLVFSGKIWDKNKNKGIQTIISNEHISFTTNSNGEFSVDINPKLFNDSIYFSFTNQFTELVEHFSIMTSDLPIFDFQFEIESVEPLIVGKISIEQPHVLIEEDQEPKLMGELVCEPAKRKKHWWLFWKKKN